MNNTSIKKIDKTGLKIVVLPHTAKFESLQKDKTKSPKTKKRKKMSKLAQKKRNPKSGYWARQADTLWFKYQHSVIKYCAVPGADFTGIEVSEDGMRCEGNTEIHHLIEKSQHAKARHLIENAIGLCSKHHRFGVELSAHQGQVKFYEFLRLNFPEKHEFFLKYKFTSTNDYNYEEAYYMLKELINV